MLRVQCYESCSQDAFGRFGFVQLSPDQILINAALFKELLMSALFLDSSALYDPAGERVMPSHSSELNHLIMQDTLAKV